MQQHPELPHAFAKLGIEVRFLKALRKMEFVEPTDIQRAIIPPALAGRDIVGQARTGTGKTAAFALPILQRMEPAGRLQAICLVPTRELAIQVTSEIQRLSELAGLHIVAVYGGQKIATQLHKLGKKPHFVVGTPGRVLDFMRRRVLNMGDVRFSILDEVDRMLDIGFRDDIKAILGTVRGRPQTIFVSATIDGEIRKLARNYTTNPVEANVSRDQLTVDSVDQSYVSVERYDKFRVLRLILDHEDPPITIVFCNTKAAARKLAKKLFDAGINADEIHGDLMQRKRDRVMDRFRRHKVSVLVATDLAARGIDVSAITHIINYDVPVDSEIYVHRIGRTARMGKQGIAITFVTREEGKQLTKIEMLINREISQRTVPGFIPRPPREQSPGAAGPKQPAPVSRFHAPVHEAKESTDSKPVSKTLGSRFRPARGRRRL